MDSYFVENLKNLYLMAYLNMASDLSYSLLNLEQRLESPMMYVITV